MSATERSAKDKAMAAHLREHHVVRTVGRCGICHYLVGLERAMFDHLRGCPGRQRTVRR